MIATTSARGNAEAGEAEACRSSWVELLVLHVRRSAWPLAEVAKTSALRANEERRCCLLRRRRRPPVFGPRVGVPRKTCPYTPEPSSRPKRNRSDTDLSTESGGPPSTTEGAAEPCGACTVQKLGLGSPSTLGDLHDFDSRRARSSWTTSLPREHELACFAYARVSRDLPICSIEAWRSSLGGAPGAAGLVAVGDEDVSLPMASEG